MDTVMMEAKNNTWDWGCSNFSTMKIELLVECVGHHKDTIKIKDEQYSYKCQKCVWLSNLVKFSNASEYRQTQCASTGGKVKMFKGDEQFSYCLSCINLLMASRSLVMPGANSLIVCPKNWSILRISNWFIIVIAKFNAHQGWVLQEK